MDGWMDVWMGGGWMDGWIVKNEGLLFEYLLGPGPS